MLIDLGKCKGKEALCTHYEKWGGAACVRIGKSSFCWNDDKMGPYVGKVAPLTDRIVRTSKSNALCYWEHGLPIPDDQPQGWEFGYDGITLVLDTDRMGLRNLVPTKDSDQVWGFVKEHGDRARLIVVSKEVNWTSKMDYLLGSVYSAQELGMITKDKPEGPGVTTSGYLRIPTPQMSRGYWAIDLRNTMLGVMDTDAQTVPMKTEEIKGGPVVADRYKYNMVPVKGKSDIQRHLDRYGSGALVSISRKDPGWNTDGLMDYLLGTVHKLSDLQVASDGVRVRRRGDMAGDTWSLRFSDLDLMVPVEQDERDALRPEVGTALEYPVAQAPISGRVKQVASGMYAANKGAAMVGLHAEAGRLVLSGLTTTVSKALDKDGQARKVLESPLGKLGLANMLQVAHSTGIAKGKTDEALGYVADGALLSAYIEAIHSLDIDGLLGSITKTAMETITSKGESKP
jgi:hypothetical protein